MKSKCTLQLMLILARPFPSEICVFVKIPQNIWEILMRIQLFTIQKLDLWGKTLTQKGEAHILTTDIKFRGQNLWLNFIFWAFKSGKPSEDVPFAGENFIRHTGESKDFAAAQVFAWDAMDKGVDVHFQAEPTKAAVLRKSYKGKKVK